MYITVKYLECINHIGPARLGHNPSRNIDFVIHSDTLDVNIFYISMSFLQKKKKSEKTLEIY